MKKLIISIDSYKIRYYHPLKESRNTVKTIIINLKLSYRTELVSLQNWRQ